MLMRDPGSGVKSKQSIPNRGVEVYQFDQFEIVAELDCGLLWAAVLGSDIQNQS